MRELEHLIERSVLLGRDRRIGVSDLPASFDAREAATATFRGDILPLREIQRRYAAWAYEQLGGKKVLTASMLDVDFRTLNKLLATPPPEGRGRE